MIKFTTRLRELTIHQISDGETSKLDGANLLLQIHDELIVETDELHLKKVKEIVTKEMESALTLDVPLFVNTKVSDSLANFN